MTKLERLLKLPAPVITLLWVAGAIPLPMARRFSGQFWNVTVAPAYAPALWCGVVLILWTYALYHASIRRVSPASLQLGRRVFLVGAVSFVVVVALSHIAYGWRGTPPASLFVGFGIFLAVAVLCLITVTFNASRAFSEYEAATLRPGDKQPNSPLLAILFIGIGIWFLRGRIERMLKHPPLAEAAT